MIWNWLLEFFFNFKLILTLFLATLHLDNEIQLIFAATGEWSLFFLDFHDLALYTLDVIFMQWDKTLSHLRQELVVLSAFGEIVIPILKLWYLPILKRLLKGLTVVVVRFILHSKEMETAWLTEIKGWQVISSFIWACNRNTLLVCTTHEFFYYIICVLSTLNSI